ncbi:fibronectin type III domain-containing protein 5 isoform X1 [Esox lucius]|uniref:fibronectin type III domain-containing protein 5 isoform X1 n=1 Tax=Esox lucius TaxID=8010 RepID=UPI000577A25A|nr:fibronectin type III domain-containing protein 5 isoform X1 [Esox lucius]XP_019905620.1 fibronectin type III domain-containing protein 5 isoform X1 [Esox lucius]XP_034150486.1 fibronectin type III domain-containing protein 5 isoform X1 [Esox lucius]
MGKRGFSAAALSVLVLGCWLTVSSVTAGDSSLSAPLNVTIRELEVNSAIVTWDILEGDPVIGFAITQQKRDVRTLRYIQEVNTTTRSCALWDLEEDTEYIVHVQSISMGGSGPPSDPVSFRTRRESEKLASTGPDQVSKEDMEKAVQLRAGELIIIVVVLVMWAGVILLFCRQYDIIKDNEPNNNKDKAKTSSECSTPEHQQGGLLRSNV